jgi:hypothetical protein
MPRSYWFYKDLDSDDPAKDSDPHAQLTDKQNERSGQTCGGKMSAERLILLHKSGKSMILEEQ